MTREVTVLYEGRDYVIVNKPAGVLSEAGNGENMCSMLKEALGREVYPVHRLDRDVSGVMIYALSSKAAGMLSAAEYEKEYIAETKKAPESDAGVMEDLLFHDGQTNKTFVVKKERKGVKKAVLSYNVEEKGDGYCRIRLRLGTGRTHQIRVQLASRGMPITGDGKYGGGSGELRLTSVKLSFTDPFDGEKKVFGI